MAKITLDNSSVEKICNALNFLILNCNNLRYEEQKEAKQDAVLLLEQLADMAKLDKFYLPAIK